MQPTALIGKENNFLAGLCGAHEGLGLALVDVSTGEFKLTEFTGEQANRRVADELQRLLPRELLIPTSWGAQAAACLALRSHHGRSHPVTIGDLTPSLPTSV